MLGTMHSRVLPTGTVTFLFSDIEGSTRMVQDLGPAVFTGVLEQHNGLIREAVERHAGVERGTQGDSFLVLFREAPAAVEAAVEIQRALQAASWPSNASVAVRMGLHTGLGRLGGDDYVSVDVHRAARIAGLAHGGQVLLSDATRALVEDNLPVGVTLRALGEHRLRDLERTERIHQLVIDGLRSEFPAVRSGTPGGGNLPLPLTSFVGRGRELAEAAALLETHRLVTFTGPGGTGKTRLAVELGRTAAGRFDDGVWFVPLDAVRDPALVPVAVATMFSLLEAPGSTPLERTTRFLADRSTLLVLDNFEQVLEAGPMVGELLRGAPGVHVLITSRSPLRLSMEQEYPVRPLSMPEVGGPDGPDLGSDAARLFIERANRVRPGFAPAPDEATAIAEICRRLDGLPLGIELAAARVGLLGPAAIADRLAKALDLPGGGTRDLPERQRTLDAAIGWSHDLLAEPERRLLARLSVFAGGARLEEIEAIAAETISADTTIDDLSALVDQSLVQPVPGAAGARFRLLETIRRFAAHRLAELGETEALRRRHAERFLALAEHAAEQMPGSAQVHLLDMFSADNDNFRAALDWAVDADEVELAHRFVAALWRYWQFRGRITEGTAVTERVLAMPGADQPTAWRAAGLDAAGGLAWWAGDAPRADSHYTEQERIARLVGEPGALAGALFNLTHTRFQTAGDNAAELAALRDEARRLWTEAGDERALARLAWSASYALVNAGDLETGYRLAIESLEQFERSGDEFYVALAAAALAGFELVAGNVSAAFSLGLRSLQSNVAMGDTASATLMLRSGSLVLFLAGRTVEAATIAGAHEAHSRRYGYRPPLDMEGWLGLAPVAEQLERAMASPDALAARQRGAEMTLPEVMALLEEVERQGTVVGGATAPAPPG